VGTEQGIHGWRHWPKSRHIHLKGTFQSGDSHVLGIAATAALQYTLAVTPSLAVSLDAVNAVAPAKRMSADRAIDLGMTTFFGAESSVAKLISAGRVTPNAATDIGTIFSPVTPCRLVDTRGSGARRPPVGPSTYSVAVVQERTNGQSGFPAERRHSPT
jgi:hypothetical protein